MTAHVLPDVNTLVDVTYDGHDYGTRIEDFNDDTLLVAAPLNGALEPPELGSVVYLRWTASVRGRCVAPFVLIATNRRVLGGPVRCWEFRLHGPIQVDQRRRYVRAGGGEPVRLRAIDRPMPVTLTGHVTDLSEGGLRCRFNYANIVSGERVSVTLPLDDDVLAVEGEVLRVIEDSRGAFVDVIVVYDLTESMGNAVRRYVMRQQILARREAANAAY